MRNLLERAIVHLLNGDQAKAEALFHKFMVERAREIRSLDNARPEAFAALGHVADEAWQDWEDRRNLQGDHRLRDFFAR